MTKIYFAAILLGSFLLFQVQPLIGKITLPFFGGNAAVWTTCMFFFQSMLFLGYLYAHLVAKLTLSRQLITHLVLALASLSFLPLAVEIIELGSIPMQPIWDLFFTLFLAIGIPYLLLSTSVPLIQKWTSLSQNNTSENYHFFALSNLGSLAGLITYPFIFEPNLNISHQSGLWSIGFIIYIAIILAICFNIYKNRASYLPQTKSNGEPEQISPGRLMYWIMLSATGVSLLLSITNATTQNIPPVPFLWIAPLSLYLLTYIVCFSKLKFYNRKITGVVFLLSSFAMFILFHTSALFDIFTQLIVYYTVLTTGCLLCHGELVDSKPSEKKLTTFYLCLSFGGFLGGLFVSFIAPLLFKQFIELPITVMLVLLAILLASYQQSKVFSSIWALGSALILAWFAYLNISFKKTDVYNSRNFYGTLTVKEIDVDGATERRLVDGTTTHGAQNLAEPDRPLAYFSHDSGVGLLIKKIKQNQSLNAGIIGLGTGTLVSYGDQDDQFTFFELNPDVKHVAENHFSYLSDTDASVSIEIGDGRISLNKRDPKESRFNLFVLDAFSSDSIPKHLLTVQSFELYWKHIKEDGVLALHISNAYLDLLPVIKTAAEELGMQILFISKFDEPGLPSNSDWVIMTKNDSILNDADLLNAADQFAVQNAEPIRWTDDFSSLLQVLKF